jgi:hypothetical protein
VYDKLVEVANLALYEWHVDMIVPGAWTISLYERLGRDLTDTVIIMYGLDSNGVPDYREEVTTFANSITYVGKVPIGDSPGPFTRDPSVEWERRPKATYTDWDSVGQYGLSEDTVEVQDISDPNTLMALARRDVELRKFTHRTLTFPLNRERGLWSKFADGDVVCVHLPFYMFGGAAVPFRVLGRQINEDTETMTVTGEVVVGAKAQALSMYRQAHYSGDAGRTRPLNPGDNPLVETKTTF